VSLAGLTQTLIKSDSVTDVGRHSFYAQAALLWLFVILYDIWAWYQVTTEQKWCSWPRFIWQVSVPGVLAVVAVCVMAFRSFAAKIGCEAFMSNRLFVLIAFLVLEVWCVIEMTDNICQNSDGESVGSYTDSYYSISVAGLLSLVVTPIWFVLLC
jgi:hypothetical protein